MKARHGTSSYAHEIAKKAWEDMRKSKRRSADAISNPTSSPSSTPESITRLSPSEAALAMRIRMEEKKKKKDAQSSSIDIHGTSATTPKPTPASKIGSSVPNTNLDFHHSKTKMNSFEEADSSSSNEGDYNIISLKKLSPEFSRAISEKRMYRGDYRDRQLRRNKHGKNSSQSEDIPIQQESPTVLTGSGDKVRILADFTEGPGARPFLGTLERAGTQPPMLKRCSPRHIEAQIYGVRRPPDTARGAHRPLSPLDEPIDLVLRLSLSFSSIRDMPAFRRQVAESVARAAGVPAEAVWVEGVGVGRVGTVVVELRLHPAATDHQGHPAADVAENLLAQALDEGSLLLAGRHTCRTISLALAGAPPPRPAGLDVGRDAAPGSDGIPAQVVGLLEQVEAGGGWPGGAVVSGGCWVGGLAGGSGCWCGGADSSGRQGASSAGSCGDGRPVAQHAAVEITASSVAVVGGGQASCSGGRAACCGCSAQALRSEAGASRCTA